MSHTYDSSGDYTVTLTVTDDEGATDTTSQVVSVSDASSGGSMHVHAIAQYLKGPHLWIDVTIHDDSDAPVSGATVDIGVCDSSDTCVTGLTHSSLTWDTAADHADDGSCETETI